MLKIKKAILPLIFSQFTFGPRTMPQNGLCNRTFAFLVSPIIAKGIRDHGTLFACRTCVLCIRKCRVIFPIAIIAWCIGSHKVLLQYKHLVWIMKYNNFYSSYKRWFRNIKADNLRGFSGFNQAHDPSELDSRLLPLHVIQASPLHP